MNPINLLYLIAIVTIIVIMAGLTAFVLIINKVTKSNYGEIATIKNKEKKNEDC